MESEIAVIHGNEFWKRWFCFSGDRCSSEIKEMLWRTERRFKGFIIFTLLWRKTKNIHQSEERRRCCEFDIQIHKPQHKPSARSISHNLQCQIFSTMTLKNTHRFMKEWQGSIRKMCSNNSTCTLKAFQSDQTALMLFYR